MFLFDLATPFLHLATEAICCPSAAVVVAALFLQDFLLPTVVSYLNFPPFSSQLSLPILASRVPASIENSMQLCNISSLISNESSARRRCCCHTTQRGSSEILLAYSKTTGLKSNREFGAKHSL
jgi:hypothetical protein